jgi:biotin synthase
MEVSTTPSILEINELLKLPLLELISLANRTRAENFGSNFELCGIINAKSGLCSQDCKFCAQSVHYQTNALTYQLLTEEAILAAAQNAEAAGAERFGIVTGGHSVNQAELSKLAQMISVIKKNTNLKVCASLGILGKDDLSLLKQAGLSRYHHNLETSAAFFPQICSTHDFKDRIKTVRNAQQAGLEVCSGGIIGLGEDWKDRIEMAITLKELAVTAVPLNILVPIEGTPLESAAPLSPVEIIRTIAIFRIILKDQVIKVVAGREKMLKDFQGLAFMAGANGMFTGGYLTINGREVEEDQKLVKAILKAWEIS